MHCAEILCYSVTERVTALCRDLLGYSVTEWLCYSVCYSILQRVIVL